MRNSVFFDVCCINNDRRSERSEESREKRSFVASAPQDDNLPMTKRSSPYNAKVLNIVAGMLLVFCVVNVTLAVAHEFSGYISVETRGFLRDPIHPGQERDNISLAFQPEYYHEWENGSSFTFVPFGRIDSADKERTHFDVRELNYLLLNDSWELRAGVGKVFWGVTESQHLVDIINQTDLVESIDEEEKLGQPMLHLSVPREWGTLDMFALPYFRERTFSGRRGRLRAANIVDYDQVMYESSAEDKHFDLAVRYSNTIGNWDFGLSHFRGTSREPTFVPGTSSGGEFVWIPLYEIVNQTGLDAQLVAGPCLWKLESIYRSGQNGQNFFALTGGFEYTFTAVNSSGMDVGVLSEWLFDDRHEDSTSGYDNDIMLGSRLSFNDAASTEALVSFVQDLDNRGLIFVLESSRRISDNWKVSLESYFLIDSSANESLYALRKDNYVQVEASYYF